MGISGEPYNLENCLSGRFRRVVLNGQTSFWRPVLAGVPQGSILGPLLFLTYMNDLPNELKSNVKLFADDRTLFTIVKDKNESANIINNDLLQISRAYNSKMFFNPDPNKPCNTIYKAFLRPLIEYGDITYDQPQNESFREKLESLQYKTALAIKGAIQKTSRDKIYPELGLASLKSRIWHKRLSCMFKMM